MKKLFTLLLAVVASVGTMCAWDYEHVQIGNLYYNLDATNQTAEVTSQNSDYPYWSTTITTANIPSSVTYNSVSYSVTSIGDCAFAGCSGLTSVTIGNSVTSIGKEAFDGCYYLTSITIGATTPPALGEYAFYFRNHYYCFIYVPCATLETYKSADGWEEYADQIKYASYYSITKIAKNGHISNTDVTVCEDPNTPTIITATPDRGYRFVRWGDGNTDNPRTIYLDKDTTMEAIFDYALTGKCGKDSALVWTLDTTTLALNITGSGELTENYSYGQFFKYLTIGSEVTKIGEYAFNHCDSLISVTIGNGVTNIGYSAFYYCTSLTSVTIGNSVTSIGGYAFYGCAIENLILGKSVKIIEGAAFVENYDRKNGTPVYDFDGNIIGLKYTLSIKTITCYSMRPPTVQWNNSERSFPADLPYSTIIYVPASYATYYQVHDFWGLFDVQAMGYVLTLSVNNVDYGTVEGAGTYAENAEAVILAKPYDGYHFVRWSDGNTDNPRTIVMTKDLELTAEFSMGKSGVCGKDNALRWTYEDKTKTLTISGRGELTENYTYGVEAPSQMKVLIIGNEVTAIGERAFYGKSTIRHLTIGGGVTTIGDYAFAECNKFDDITCYAEEEPLINATTFDNVGNKQYIYLFVPESRVRAYKRDTYWGEFDVQGIGAEKTETEEVTVSSTETTASVAWPSVSDAYTYELVIRDKSGNVICTLIFNSAGQLTSIAFMPSRDDAPQKTQTAGFSFTVTGLEAGTSYDLAIVAKDESGQELDKKDVQFTTTGETQAIEDLHVDTDKPVKVYHEGQVYILRGEKIYTLTGQEVK